MGRQSHHSLFYMLAPLSEVYRVRDLGWHFTIKYMRGCLGFDWIARCKLIHADFDSVVENYAQDGINELEAMLSREPVLAVA